MGATETLAENSLPLQRFRLSHKAQESGLAWSGKEIAGTMNHSKPPHHEIPRRHPVVF